MESHLRFSNGRRFALYASLRTSNKGVIQKVVGTDPMGMTREQVLDDLETHHTKSNNAEILNLLQHLKEWRNKFAHPEKLLTQEEAEDLYMMTMYAPKTGIKLL
jgi:hypothetical protein